MKKLLKIEPKRIQQHDIIKYLKSKKDFEIYFSWCQTEVPFSLCDRTQTFDMPLNFHIRHPIKPLSSNVQTYSDACDSRAKEIIELAEKTDSMIYVFWSGGLDSTVILTSFLSNSTDIQQKRFTVLLTQNSIKENPIFFKNFILGKLSYESAIVDFSKIFNREKSIFVHGESQDQMYATPGNKMHLSQELDDIATPNSLMKYLVKDQDNQFSMELSEDLTYMLSTSAQSVGLKLEKKIDFLWWRSFCFGSQSTDVRFFQSLNLKDDSVNVELLDQNIITFFMSPKFDQFIMHRVQNNKVSILNEYKKEPREYIFAFDKNVDYYKNKGKVGSGPALVASEDSHYALDDSFRSVSPETLMEYYNPNNVFSKYR